MKTVTLYFKGTPIVHKPISQRQIHIGTGSDNDLIFASSTLRDCRLTMVLDNQGRWQTTMEGQGVGKEMETAVLVPGKRIELGEYEIGFSTLDSHTQQTPADHMGMVGDSLPMQQLRQRVRQLGPLNGPVLIEGESGTGKELTARALHDWSKRNTGPFVTVNCGGVTETMAEDLFFGHERGAFTGASQHHKGVFERAHCGTLFLDEIGELPLCHQASLLRVLDTKVVSRIGSEQSIHTDFRLVAATNRDLTQMVAEKTFRLDLYHRISALQLQPSPLRVRKYDIPLLARYFLSGMQGDVGTKHLSSDATEKLMEYPWPGNCRELRNVLYKAAAFCERTTLLADDLDIGDEARAMRRQLADDDTIVQELFRQDGNVSAASRALGIPRTTLRHRLKGMESEV